jgi:uncharacterized membrane protein YdbT with pleckstrin-like domain
MSRVEDNLMPNEKVIYRTHLHWGIFILPAILTLLSFGIFIFLLIWVFLRTKTSEFVLTDKRVIIHVGVLSSKSIEILLNKVEGIGVQQGLFGRMFGYGSLVVGGTGGTKEVFKFIENPFEFRKQVQQQIEVKQ